MKLLVTTLTVTLALTSSLASANSSVALKRLSCVISNGTTVETVARRATGVVVETRLGLLSQDFAAALVVDEETKKTTVELTNEAGRVAYLLDLTIDLTTSKKQTRVGAVVRTGDGSVAPTVVATTLCDLTVR